MRVGSLRIGALTVQKSHVSSAYDEGKHHHYHCRCHSRPLHEVSRQVRIEMVRVRR